jgi:modification methylase
MQKITGNFNGENWSLFIGDCISVMKTFDEKITDYIITSPPYNLGTSSGGGFPTKKNGKWNGGELANGYLSHDDSMSVGEYRNWQREFLLEAWRLVSDQGAIFYNHKPRIQNGLVELPTEWNPGLPLRQIIIWKRKGGINFSSSFFLPTHEYILVFAKPGFRLKNKGVSGIGDVWEMACDLKNKHPAPFPLELPEKILSSVKRGNGIVIDPFCGSSTTGVAAINNGYYFIGIDKEEKYIEMSVNRLNSIKKDIFGAK